MSRSGGNALTSGGNIAPTERRSAVGKGEELPIGVYARIRPMELGLDGTAPINSNSAGFKKAQVEGVVVRSEGAVQKSVQIRNLEFSLDWVFDADATQKEVYGQVGRDRVKRVLSGYNACILAYGQTGSGKTHTMFGPQEVLSDWEGSDSEQHGIALRAISELFELAGARDSEKENAEEGGAPGRSSSTEREVRVSYVEVYNDSINDLLGGRSHLLLRETPKGVEVQGCASETVRDLGETMRVVSRGNAGRATAGMSMNARSSRSHAVFSLSLRETRRDRGGGI